MKLVLPSMVHISSTPSSSRRSRRRGASRRSNAQLAAASSQGTATRPSRSGAKRSLGTYTRIAAGRQTYSTTRLSVSAAPSGNTRRRANSMPSASMASIRAKASKAIEAVIHGGEVDHHKSRDLARHSPLGGGRPHHEAGPAQRGQPVAVSTQDDRINALLQGCVHVRHHVGLPTDGTTHGHALHPARGRTHLEPGRPAAVAADAPGPRAAAVVGRRTGGGR